jgi:hypothetical protein
MLGALGVGGGRHLSFILVCHFDVLVVFLQLENSFIIHGTTDVKSVTKSLELEVGTFVVMFCSKSNKRNKANTH